MARPSHSVVDDTALSTPAFVVILDRVRRNCERMRQLASTHGFTLRPHVKTHKSTDIARLQVGVDDRSNCGAIVVSTLLEAEAMSTGGFADIIYAVAIEPSKLARAYDLHTKLSNLHVFVDSLEACSVLEDFLTSKVLAPSASAHKPWSVFIKVDAGYGRCGVPLSSDTLAAITMWISASSTCVLAGLYSHSGNAYNCASGDVSAARCQAQSIATSEFSDMTALARTLESTVGIHIPVVSIGSTPAISSGASFSLPAGQGVEAKLAVNAQPAHAPAGVTATAGTPTQVEIHPGNYVFYDRQQVESGSCTEADIACYVLARVIGRFPERNEIAIDAGACAFHKDTAGLLDGCWGCLLGDNNVVVKRIAQEVGIVGTRDGSRLDMSAYPLGTCMRFVPNHSCMTASGHSHYSVVASVDECPAPYAVVDTWVPCKFW